MIEAMKIVRSSDDFARTPFCHTKSFSRSVLERMIEAMKIVRSSDDFARNHNALKVPMGTMFHSAHTFGLHFSMFMTFVKTQSSDEQLNKWLGPTMAGHFNGAYAQTELGHGSNVRGLETTVTYDKSTEEFAVTLRRLPP